MPTDETIKITIEKPNDRAFLAAFKVVDKQLDRTQKKLERLDKLSRKVGGGLSSGGGGSRRPAAGGGRGGGGRRGGGGGRGIGITATNPTVAGAGGLGLSGLPPQALAAAAAVVVLTGALKKAVTEASRFESELNEIGRVAGFSGDELKDFGDVVADISTDLGIGTTGINAIASAGANAGLRAKDLAVFTREMARLKTILPGLNEEQTRGILRIADLTDFPTERIGELNNALVTLQQNSKSTLPELIKISQSLSQRIGIFGASAEEVTAFAATIADLGLQPQRAATGLGKFIGQLKNVSEFDDASIKRITETFRTPISVQAFRDLAENNPVEAFKEIGRESVNLRKVLKELGVTGVQAVNVENLLKNTEKFIDLQDKAQLGSTDLIDDQVANKLQEFGKQVDILSQSLTALFRETGDEIITEFLLPVVKGLNEGIKLAKEFDVSLIKLLHPLTAIGELSKVAFGGEARTKRVNDINNLLNDFRKESKDLKAAAKEIQDNGLGARANAPEIDQLDAKFTKDLEDLEKGLKRIGVSAPEIAKLTKEFVGLKASLENDDGIRYLEELKSGEDAANRLAAALGNVEDLLAKITGKADAAEIELRLSRLSPIERQLEKISIDAGKLFGETLGGPALQKLEGTLSEELSKVSQITGNTFEGSLTETIDQLNNLDLSGQLGKGGEAVVSSARDAAEILKKNQDTISQISRKRNADVQLAGEKELKRLAKARDRATEASAPDIESITSAGEAVEFINKLQRDEQEQKAQLDVLNEQQETLEKILKENKKKKFKTVQKPTGF